MLVRIDAGGERGASTDRERAHRKDREEEAAAAAAAAQSPAETRTADERTKASIVFPQRLSSEQRPAARNLPENDAESGPPLRGARRRQSR